MGWDRDWEYPRSATAAERRAVAAEAARGLRADGIEPQPVGVEGREIARTFWGRAWCAHLEALADLASRLPRGRSYLRGGSVVDLRIRAGEVVALVAGTALYTARVTVRTLPASRWAAVRRACAGRVGTVVELLSGQLSDGVMRVLCDVEGGLFPASRELQLHCSCPDGARLCKHLAAVLYGVGARLDAAPELLFTLRGVSGEELVTAAARGGALAGATASGAEALPGEDLAALFGIVLDGSAEVVLPDAPHATRPARAGAPRTGHRRGSSPSGPRRGATAPGARAAGAPRRRG